MYLTVQYEAGSIDEMADLHELNLFTAHDALLHATFIQCHVIGCGLPTLLLQLPSSTTLLALVFTNVCFHCKLHSPVALTTNLSRGTSKTFFYLFSTKILNLKNIKGMFLLPLEKLELLTICSSYFTGTIIARANWFHSINQTRKSTHRPFFFIILVPGLMLLASALGWASSAASCHPVDEKQHNNIALASNMWQIFLYYCKFNFHCMVFN